MLLDLGAVATGDGRADVGAQLSVGPAAGVGLELGGVLGQERLAQPFAGTVGEGGDRVGAHAEDGRDVGGLVALDLGVPEHQLPALGQRGERPGRGRALEALDGRVDERHAGVEGLHVVGRVQPRGRPDAVDLQAPYGRQQVGAEGHVGPAAALQHAEHLDERLGHQVVGVGGRHELPGEASGGLDVALEEGAVGVDVPAADRRDQLGVPRCLDAGRNAHVLGRFPEASLAPARWHQT